MIGPAYKVVLDTNVLFPSLLRDILLRAAEKGLFAPYWSARILASLERVLAESGHVDAVAAARICQTIKAAFPEALVEDFEHLTSAMPNHENDRHVAAAATSIAADVIVTSNIRHFAGLPPKLEVLTPDAFLVALLDRAPSVLQTILEKISADYRNPPQSLAELVARLGRVTPDFQADLRVLLRL